MKWQVVSMLFVPLVLACGNSADGAVGPVEITILYDNYTLTEGCTPDWGFACIIKGMQKCILFDTGTNGSILLGNMDKLQVSAGDVELVVISHDHADHTGGLAPFLGRNSNVTAYLPLTASAGLVQTVQSRGATARLPNEAVQICEGVHVAGSTIMGQVEQFLILETPKGLAVITGCAHPGIVQMIQTAKQLLGKEIYFVFGGFHLLDLSDSAVMSIIRQFQSLGVQKAGASHCTGGRAIALFKQQYGEHFVPLGVGRISIPPVVDFNGDEIVDIEDLVVLIEHWGQNDPAVDIAPPLFGDGVVDRKDLEVLMGYWGQEIPNPALIAHWKLDEAEGPVATDSAGPNDGVLVGNPVWQPAGGKLGGALQFDGADDHVTTPFVCDPSEGPLSVVAWVKGGAPGQVILSQEKGANWLMLAPSGALMTELKQSGRQGKVLTSSGVITDGVWHRVGLVYDGSNRVLYVDDLEVARDAQAGLEGARTGLYIGAGKGMETGSFFSGLIDDVRVYNQAVSP